MDFQQLVEISEDALTDATGRNKELARQPLSAGELSLLQAAATTGNFYVLSTEQTPGHWVRADDRDYCDDADAAVAARYLDAFISLCRRGYVRHESGQLFILTGAGFEAARSRTG